MKPEGWKGSIKKGLTFNRTSFLGLVTLVTSFFMGALLRKSATLTNEPTRRFFATCDTYVKGLCIPTAYFSIPMGPLGQLVVNFTSALVSVLLFIMGVILVRK